METKRPTSPGAEEILDLYFPILDHGFIALKDYCGTDKCIEEMARTSYSGGGTRQVNQTRGLIRYLKRHQHTSPFEGVELKFHISMPIFCARQFIRHRTACLSGDTLLYFDEPAALKNGKRKRRSISIKQFYENWKYGFKQKTKKLENSCIDNLDDNKEYTVSELSLLVNRAPENIRFLIQKKRLKTNIIKQNNIKDPLYKITKQQWIDYVNDRPDLFLHRRDVLQSMNLRSCNENTGEIIATNINDIWSNGVKPVFNVILENGYSLKMTKDHLCLTEDGWKTLEEATNIKLGLNDTVTWHDDSPNFAINGELIYQNKEWISQCRNNGYDVQQMADEAGCSYHTIRKYIKKFNLCFSSIEKSKLSGLKQRGQKRTIKNRKPFTEEALKNIKIARSGSNSNFWKGGISSERENIGRWTRDHSKIIFKKYNYKCVICNSSNKLNAHHIDPVWHNKKLAKEIDNLICLCKTCHQIIHSKNLELLFLEYVKNGKSLNLFLNDNNIIIPYFEEKKAKKTTKLIRSFSKIKKIEYLGEEEVFDIEVSGPYHNFVANGLIVHNSLNEISGRYSLLPMMFYTPPESQFSYQSKSNNQGRGLPASTEAYKAAIEKWNHGRKESSKFYEDLTHDGIARELSRIDLPLSTYTQMYWKIDLHNFMHLLTLRVDPHAQWEIREYGSVFAGMMKQIVPMAFEAWYDYEFCSVKFSRMEMEVLHKLIAATKDQQGSVVVHNSTGFDKVRIKDVSAISTREATELYNKLESRPLPNFDLDLSRAKPASFFEEEMARATPNIDKHEGQ